MYQIKLEVFEGPFDLLLSLINKQKLDIYDVPIARIIEEYLAYVRQMEDFNLEIASEFLLIAATLIEIKAAALLPSVKTYDEAETISPREARDILIARLIEYKKFKNSAMALAAMAEGKSRSYPREAELEERFVKLRPDFLVNATVEDLSKLLIGLLAKKQILVDSPHITPIEVSLEEKIGVVLAKLKSARKETFRALTSDCSNKIEVIVTFLALLELYKAGLISFNQAETFGEIEVSLDEVEKKESPKSDVGSELTVDRGQLTVES